MSITDHIDFLARRVAQPIADIAHDHFGVTCYRLAVQLPIAAIVIEAFHGWLIGDLANPYLLLLVVVWIRRAWLFHRIDIEAAKRDYTIKPAECVGAPISAFLWEVMALFDTACIPIPPSSWTDALSVLACICLMFAWLLIMCDVRPRRRAASPAKAAMSAV